MKNIIIAAIMVTFLPGGAMAAPAPAPDEATIHFADHGAIQNWQADGREALYLQGNGSQWYHATLMGPCIDLDFADTIGFEPGPLGDFDRYSTLIVRSQHCAVRSVVESGPPPSKKDKPKN